MVTGDYLAELTMLILGRDRLKNPAGGYARTFLGQLEECLGLAHERNVRIVTNAGGLNPAGLADAVRESADRLGIPVRVAHVEGDDLTGSFSRDPGTGRPAAPPAGLLAAHAYLGGHGIAACLREGADIVVTGRVTDAALVAGPALAHFGWGRRSTTGWRARWSPDTSWSAGRRPPVATTPSSPHIRPSCCAGPASRWPNSTRTAAA